MFVRADHEVPQSFALGETLKAHLKCHHDRTVDAVYWKFRAVRSDPERDPAHGEGNVERRGAR